MFRAAIFIKVRNCKQPSGSSIEEQIKKMWYIYSMDYYSGIDNKDIMKSAGK